MSEISLFIRQGNVNRASFKGQKRPLSIITENESDDLDVIDYTKYQDTTDCSGKENSSFSKDSSDSNKTYKDNDVISNLENKTSPKSSSVTSKQAGEKNVKNTEIQNSKDNSHSQLSETVQSETSAICDVTQINNLVSLRPCVDVRRLERLQDTAERPQLQAHCSPTSPSPSSTIINNKFGQRLWPQTSIPRNLNELISPLGYSHQHLPSIGGTPLLVSLALASSPDSDDNTDTINGQFPSDFSDNCLSQSQTNRPSIFSKALKPSKLSAYFSRRMSNESTGSLSESDLSDGEIGSEDSQSTYLSYFRRLKETTDRLSLSTRRPSIMLWRQQYLESQSFPRARSNQNGDMCDESLTSDRRQRIDKALEWLRNQLQEMRSQDQNLARQLLAIRHDIHKLKLQRSTEEHQELIDDFHFEMQEIQELSDVLDLPMPEYGDNPLKHIGVTRLNISARRFSAC